MSIEAKEIVKDLGVALQCGRSSEIYKWDEDKVVKLYLEEYPEKEVDLEYTNTKEAYRLGATPMQVFDKIKIGNRYGMIISKLEGISINDAPIKKPSIIFTAGKILAEEHVKLQKCHSDILPDVREVASGLLDKRDVFDFLSGEEVAKLKAYIMALPSDNTFLHLDFHTGNVLIDTKSMKTVVIDWMTAMKGKREIEVAMMKFLFAEAELFPEASALERALYSIVRKSIGKSFLKNYQKLTGIDMNEVDKYYVVALIIRYGLWTIAYERPYISRTLKKFVSEL